MAEFVTFDFFAFVTFEILQNNEICLKTYLYQNAPCLMTFCKQGQETKDALHPCHVTEQPAGWNTPPVRPKHTAALVLAALVLAAWAALVLEALGAGRQYYSLTFTSLLQVGN